MPAAHVTRVVRGSAFRAELTPSATPGVGPAEVFHLTKGLVYELRCSAEIAIAFGSARPGVGDERVYRDVPFRFVADTDQLQIAAATSTPITRVWLHEEDRNVSM